MASGRSSVHGRLQDSHDRCRSLEIVHEEHTRHHISSLSLPRRLAFSWAPSNSQ